MAFGQTVTAVAAVSSVTSSLPIEVSAGVERPVVVIAAASVTSGAVVQLEGRDDGPKGTVGSYRTLGDRVTIDADGNTVVPLDEIKGAKRPDDIRLTVISRTDGSYTLSLVETP